MALVGTGGDWYIDGRDGKMEYVVTANRPFGQIEARTIAALEEWGFAVQRTFSLDAATGAGGARVQGGPSYCVLMLYALGDERRPLGLITIYEREGRTVINPAVVPPFDTPSRQVPRDEDIGAELAAALALSGLELCIHTAGGTECIDLDRTVDEEDEGHGPAID
jgi:hypothetical protein